MGSNKKKLSNVQIKEIKEKVKDKVLHFMFTDQALERMQKEKELPKEEKHKFKVDTLKEYSSIIGFTITMLVAIFVRLYVKRTKPGRKYTIFCTN